MNKSKLQLKNGIIIASLMTAVVLAGPLTTFAQEAAAPAEPAKSSWSIKGFFENIGKVLEKTYNNMTGKTVEAQ